MQKKLKSKCCSAEMFPVTIDTGAYVYACSSCTEVCDLKSRVKRVKAPVEPQIATDEEARQFADHLESVASFKRSGIEDLENANYFFGIPRKGDNNPACLASYGQDRPCEKGCKGDSTHEHVTVTTAPEPVRWYSTATEENHKSIESAVRASKRIVWFRYVVVFLLGMLAVLSYQKFVFNACNEAATHVVDKLFLRE